MSARPWMPLYVGDYRADTTHLSAAQHGAYLLLIMHYWQQGNLPDDDEQLARIACMTTAEWRKHRPIIRAFFGEGWRHARIDSEIADAEAAYERRARAGRKGGKAPRNRSNAQAMLKQSQPHPHPLRGGPSQRGDSLNVEGKALPVEAGQASWPKLAVVNGGNSYDDQEVPF